jgi:hypothetical protein
VRDNGRLAENGAKFQVSAFSRPVTLHHTLGQAHRHNSGGLIFYKLPVTLWNASLETGALVILLPCKSSTLKDIKMADSSADVGECFPSSH